MASVIFEPLVVGAPRCCAVRSTTNGHPAARQRSGQRSTATVSCDGCFVPDAALVQLAPGRRIGRTAEEVAQLVVPAPVPGPVPLLRPTHPARPPAQVAPAGPHG